MLCLEKQKAIVQWGLLKRPEDYQPEVFVMRMGERFVRTKTIGALRKEKEFKFI